MPTQAESLQPMEIYSMQINNEDKELKRSIKRLIDLIYVFGFIWGIASAIQWLSQY